MKNIMVDLETLGKGSDAVIIAIGAVEFDETGVSSTFYTNVDPQSCVDIGMKMDVSTVMWWMQQSDAARSAFKDRGVHIGQALRDFGKFVELAAGRDAEVWGNGATFDNVILANAYQLTKQVKPWQYWADRCFRTLRNLYPGIAAESFGTAHNAKDDAVKQAIHASKILAHIKEVTHA